VIKILSCYNGQQKTPYKQRLVWKLSSRTMRVLRPTDKLTSYLPTIEEANSHDFHNLRFRYVVFFLGYTELKVRSNQFQTNKVLSV
jgi:hypothetical protein